MLLKKIVSFSLLYATLALLVGVTLYNLFDVNPLDNAIGWPEVAAIVGLILAILVIFGLPPFLAFGNFSKGEGWTYTIIGIVLLLVLGGLGYVWLFKPLVAVLGSKVLWWLAAMLAVTLVAWFWPRPGHSRS